VSSTAGPSDGGQRPEPPSNIATAVAEVSERATTLIREEIELAKAELQVKATTLVKGAVVGVTAGIFFVTALLFVLIGLAWLIYYLLPVNTFGYFWGFFAMALILVVLGIIAGLIAARVMRKGSPPMPTMAIDEAQKIRFELTNAAEGHDAAAAAHAPVGAAPAQPAPPPPAPAVQVENSTAGQPPTTEEKP